MNRCAPLPMLLAAAAPLWAAGCADPAPPAGGSGIVATNSYLAAAVADLTDARHTAVCLAEPGTCPGHFDLRPGQIAALRASRLVLHFGFQRSVARQVGDAGAARRAAIQTSAGLCQPDTYAQVCGQVAESLVAAGLLDADTARARRAAIESRMADLAGEARRRTEAAGLKGRPVLAAAHQAAFCAWLGLEVRSTFTGTDTALAGEIERTLAAGRSTPPRLVVANRTEGAGLARALADRFGAPVVVLDNFPARPDDPRGFDDMLRRNVAALTGTGP